MTPHAHLMTLEKRLRALGKKADPKALEAFVASSEFDQHWLGLRGDRRRRTATVRLLAEARLACLPAKPLIEGLAPKRVRWDAARIARLQAAWQRWGTDEGVARAMGLNLEAAARARRRYIGSQVVPSTLRVAKAA